MASPSAIPAYIMGAMLTTFGALPFFSPEKDYETFGLRLEPRTISSVSEKAAETSSVQGGTSPYAYAKGVRDVTYGLAYIIFQLQNNTDAVTTLSGLVAITGVVDGLICQFCNPEGSPLKKAAWNHIFTGVGLAAWCAYRVWQY